VAKKTILVIGDTHLPFINASGLRQAENLAKQLKPNVIVQIGDLMDMYSWSKYPRTLNLITPKKELELGMKMAYQMWENLRKASPKSKCYQIYGNHDERPMLRLMEKAPELESLIDFKSIFTFPGVETSNSQRDELIIGDILFQHGFRSKLGDHARHNGMNTVCGHSHKGGVFYMRLGEKTIWELNAGYLAKEDSTPLGYTKQRRISTWTLGVGFIDHLGPRFIPFDGGFR
jgi:predicted phosphodiesterase